MRTSVDYEASFALPMRITEARASFWLEVIERLSEVPPFAVLTRDIPSVLRRFLFDVSHHLIFAVIPDLQNKIRIVIFGESGEAEKMINDALAQMTRCLAIHADLRLWRDENWADDPLVQCMAFDLYTKCCLEQIGFRFLRTSHDGEIMVESSGFAVSRLLLQTRVVCGLVKSVPLQRASVCCGFGDPCEMSFVLTVQGKAQLLEFKELREALNKEEYRRFVATQSVRLDSLPCTVLPMGVHAYAVEYSSVVPKELTEYWKYVHGMCFDSIEAVFKITFTAGNEDACLTYPAQCVLQPHIFLPKSLRKRLTEVEKGMENLTLALNTITNGNGSL